MRSAFRPARSERRKGKRKVKITEPQLATKVPYYKLFQFSTNADKFLIFLGSICAIACGFVNCYSLVFFGDITEVIVQYAYLYPYNGTKEERKGFEDDLYEAVYSYGVITAIAAICMIITNYLAVVLFSYSAINQIEILRERLFYKLLHMDMAWYDIRKAGDFASIFSENVPKIEEGIGEKAGIFIITISIFFFGTMISLLRGWELALVCLMILPVGIVLNLLLSWMSSRYARREAEAYLAANNVAEEVLNNVNTVFAYGGQEKEFERYEQFLRQAKKNNIKKSLYSGASNGAIWFFIFTSFAVSFWFGVDLVLENKVLPYEERIYTPGSIVMILFLTLLAVWNCGLIAPYFEIFGTACGAATAVFKILAMESEINNNKYEGKIPTTIKGNIDFKNVYFHFPSRPNVMILQKFNLKIKTGQTIALIGSSGCGKTTCVQLLQRFYDPISGSLTIDGNDVKELNVKWLRSKIGVVSQEPFLFAASIAENIRYGNLSASQAEIENAAKKAQAHKFIKKFPKGYDTVIGERNSQLSGGQKQRIAIARALIRNPKILILDEATSSLDPTCESEIHDTFKAISGDCVKIIIARRLSTLKHSDRIVLMFEGKVVEKGSHRKLMKQRGAYYALLQAYGPRDSTSQSTLSLTDTIRSLASANESRMSTFENPLIEANSFQNVRKQRKSLILTMLSFNQQKRFYIVVGCAMAVLIGTSLPFYGIVYGNIVGVLTSHNETYIREEIKSLCSYFFLVGCVVGIALFVQMYCFVISGEDLSFKLRSKMFRAILSQEKAWLSRRHNRVGALCIKLSREAASVQKAFGPHVGSTLNFLFTFILGCIIALFVQWDLALVVMSLSPIMLFVFFLDHKRFQNNTDENQKYLENSANVAIEGITNFGTVVSLGCEEVLYKHYVEELKPYSRNMRKLSHFRSISMATARSIMLFAYIIGIIYGAHLMVTVRLDCSKVYKVVEIIIGGSWAISNAFTFTPNFKKGIIAAGRIFYLLERDPCVKNVSNPISLQNVQGNISYNNVHFSYPSRPSVIVLKDLNLHIPQGKTVALVGTSGSGKSTVIQLLMRFYDTISGDVLIDDQNIRDLDIANLRSHIGLISQESQLFGRTIAENIAYGANHRQVTMDEIIKAATVANIHNFISALPRGYDTILGAKGTQLSGGQKQRVAIARALIRDPQILLLDEATSSLDTKNEKIVQKAIDNAKKDRTCLIVAHKISTVQDADVIYVLQNGSIVEMGEHKDLLEKKGLYYKYYKLQDPNLL